MMAPFQNVYSSPISTCIVHASQSVIMNAYCHARTNICSGLQALARLMRVTTFMVALARIQKVCYSGHAPFIDAVVLSLP